MDQSITAGKYIYAILNESEEVKNLLGTDEKKIFPIQQPADIKFPFIVFQRNKLEVVYTKDYPLQYGWDNTLQFEIACVSLDYETSVNIANAVRHSIEGYRWYDENIHIDPIKIKSVDEYVVDTDSTTAFVESITVEFTCN